MTMANVGTQRGSRATGATSLVTSAPRSQVEPRPSGPVRFLLLPAALLLAGCAAGPPGGIDPGTPAPGEGSTRTFTFEGELRAGDGSRTFAFDVGEAAQEVEALLTWGDAASTLGFVLEDAAGEEAARGWNEGEGRAYVTTTRAVTPGPWKIVVSGERAVATSFAAMVAVHDVARDEGPIVATFVLPPRDPTRAFPAEARGVLASPLPRDYAEINLNMDPGDGFRFSWRASSEAYFNVHYHGADGTTERPIEERTTALDGEFAANATEVYALLWRNEGTTEIEVEVELDGSYRLHSMTRRS